MIIVKKIKAGALQYVIVVSVIIAILIFAFISLVYLYQKTNHKFNFSKEAIQNTQLGFDYLNHKDVPYGNTDLSFLIEEENKTISLVKKHWGVFDIATIVAKVNNESFRKIGLLGYQSKKRTALYLKDNNQSLVMVGNAKIKGDVMLPKQGVKTGNIAGTSFYGNQLIYGNSSVSESKLPEIKNLDYLKSFVKNYTNEKTDFFELEEGMNFYRSFTESTAVFQSGTALELRDITLKGNVIITSKTKITINTSAMLKDVIIIAPKVFIKQNTKGNFQVFASEVIDVASNCELVYPSVLTLLENNTNSKIQNTNTLVNNKEEKKITIAKNSNIKGVVLYHSTNTSRQYKTQVFIENGALVTGEVYCTANLELYGQVNGSVTTNEFLVKKSGGIYVNHLFDGVINLENLPEQYTGLLVSQNSNAVAKWMY